MTATPKPQTGMWILTAPNGKQWQADSPLKVCGAEQRERVPARVGLPRIFAAIAQPKQPAKPVAWFEYNQDLDAWFLAYGYNPKAKTRPLFERPAPVRQPLTDLDALDAARYRYIKSQMEAGAVRTDLPLTRSIYWVGSYVNCADVKHADESIDAAIKATT